MAYFTCFVLSFFLFYIVERNKKLGEKTFWFLSILLIIYWTLLIGLQDNVGTDYHNYYAEFSNISNASRYKNITHELLFYSIANFVASFGLPPQTGFVIIALIQASVFFIFIKIMKISKPSIFILVFFTVSTIFYNQTNTLRQFVAVYLFSVSAYFILKRKFILFLIGIGIAALFHRSALIMLPAYFLPVFKGKLKPYYFVLFLFIAFLLSMIDILEIVSPLIRLTMYAHYLDGEYFYAPVALINKLTKYLYIPFFLLSLFSLNTLNNFEKKMYCIGFLSYCFRLILLPYSVLNRISMYFEILQIIPLYFLISYLLNTSEMKRYYRVSILFFFLLIVIGLLAAKVIFFPVGEYDYKSILL